MQIVVGLGIRRGNQGKGGVEDKMGSQALMALLVNQGKLLL